MIIQKLISHDLPNCNLIKKDNPCKSNIIFLGFSSFGHSAMCRNASVKCRVKNEQKMGPYSMQYQDMQYVQEGMLFILTEQSQSPFYNGFGAKRISLCLKGCVDYYAMHKVRDEISMSLKKIALAYQFLILLSTQFKCWFLRLWHFSWK